MKLRLFLLSLLVASLTMLSIAPAFAQEPVLGPSDVSNKVAYYIYTTARGGLTVEDANATGIVGTSEAGVGQTIDPTDPRQQFLFVNKEDKLYLYNMATQKFLGKGTTIKGLFTDEPVDPILFKNAGNGTVMLYFDDDHNINLGGSKQVTIDDWNTKDKGNSFIINVACPIYTESVLSKADVSDKASYYIYTTERGGLTVKDANATGIVGTSESGINQSVDPTDPRQQFVFVNWQKNLYLYNVATQKFLGKGTTIKGLFTDEPVDPILFKNASNGTVMLYFDDDHNINLGGQKQVTIDKWSDKDPGNSFIIKVAERFDQAPIIELLENDEYSGKCGENLTWTLKHGTLTISGTGDMGDLERDSPWYQYRNRIYNIIIGSGVTSIGDFAFIDCIGLTSITIPNSVTSIGYAAFDGCGSLASVAIPNSVTSIGNYAFKDCSSITSVTIPSSVTSIGDGAFQSCDGLTVFSVLAPNPPSASSSMLQNAGTKIVHVYEGFAYVYRAADGWKSYTIVDDITNPYSQGVEPVLGPTDVSDQVSYYIYTTERGGLTVKYASATDIVGTSEAGVGQIVNPTDPRQQFLFVNWEDKLYLYNVATKKFLSKGTTIKGRFTSVPVDPILFKNAGDGTVMLYFDDDHNINLDDQKQVTIDKWSDKYPGNSFIIKVAEPFDQTPIIEYLDNDAFSGKCGENLTWTLKHGTLTISGTGDMYDYKYSGGGGLIPWVDYREQISNVVINEGVTSLSYCAFYDYSKLSSVMNPNTLVNIGDFAFGRCSNLTSVTIPNSLTEIGEGVFGGCSSLTSITIPNSVRSIGNGAFYGCSGLTSVTIPNSVTEIGESAFKGCSSLTSVTIPNSVTSIYSDAFDGCYWIEEVNISCVDNDDFINYMKRTDISRKFHGGDLAGTRHNIYIGGKLCSSISIPNSITSIAESAFRDCSSLTSVTIPNSITSIGASAFKGCSALTSSVTIPNSVTYIGTEAFTGCDNVKTLIYAEGCKVALRTYLTSIESVTIPNTVTSVEKDVFKNCSSLNEVNISCINTDDFIKYVQRTDISSVFYAQNLAGKPHNIYIDDELCTAVIIPNSVASIGSFAFQGCNSLISVTIPNSVTSVGKDAFNSCSSIEEVNISCVDADDFIKYVQRADIPAVFYAQNLAGKPHNIYIDDELCTAVIIPNSVTSVGESAFSDCSSLYSVIIPNSVIRIEKNAFKGCEALSEVTIPSVQIDESVFKGCYNVRTLAYAEGCKGVLPTYLTSIESVEIPNSVKSIADGAFKNCNLLFSVEIPNSVTNIGKQAFYGCSSLETINIPNSVTLLGEDLCNGCSYISELTIGDVVEVVPARSFKGCSLLKKVVIGESVREIESEAFAGCARIVEIDALPIVPPTCASNAVFDSYVYKAAMVYVPNERNAIGRYRAEAVWKDFFDIAEREVVAIGSVTNDTDSVSNAYYNLQGQRNTVPTHGINIINGKKTLVR